MEISRYDEAEKEDWQAREQLYQSQSREVALRSSGVLARSEGEAYAAGRKITHVFVMAEEATERLAHLDNKVERLSMLNPALRYSLQRLEVTAALAAEGIIQKYAR